jgi:hypothetical protein
LRYETLPAGRRIGAGENCPAPEIALARHQPLAGLQLPAQRLPRLARHHADLRQSARQLDRAGDEFAKRLSTLR